MPPLSAPPLLTLARNIISNLSFPSSAAEFLDPIPSSDGIVSPSSSPHVSPPSTPLPQHDDFPDAALALFPTHPSAALELSRSKLHTYPFADVPAYWLRVFVDASLLVAAWKIRRHFSKSRTIDLSATAEEDAVTEISEGREEHESAHLLNEYYDDECENQNATEDWISSVVRDLDMALLMAGGLGRTELIAALLSELDAYLEDRVNKDPKYSGEPAMGNVQRPIKRMKFGHDDGNYPDSKQPSWLPVSSDIFSVELDGTAPQIHFPITRHVAPSMWEFEQHLWRHDGKGGGPIVIIDALEDWPARRGERAWSQISYLMARTMGGRRLVPIEVGRSYTDEGWGQKIVTFREFVNEYLVTRSRKDVGYLAQHDLVKQIPDLRNDIYIPDYCFTSPPTPLRKPPGKEVAQLEHPLLNTWFGPAGTVSPLHTDPYHNILCQVVGKKYVRLYSPEESEKLYPRGVEANGVDMSNTSNVDVEGDVSEQNENFPLFREATYVEAILEEGECLYIPIGWWHYVKSVTVSFSVSFWWN